MKAGHPEVTKRARLSVSTLDEAKRSFEVVASTEAVDSHGEIVRQDWRLDRFKANPVVFFGHESWDLPIGKAEDVRVEGGALRMRVTLLSAAANPRAEQVFQAMREGALKGVSVGFKVGKRTTEKVGDRERQVLSENELLELSVVGIPANPEARAKDGRHGVGAITENAMKDFIAKALDMSKDASDEAVEKALDKTITDILDAAGVKSLGAVTGAVEKLKAERDAHAEKANRLAKLEAEVAEKAKKAAEEKLAATIDEAVKAGKVTPAKRPEIETKAAKFGQEWLDELVASLPVQGGSGPGPTPPATDVATVDGELKQALPKFGLTEDDFRAARAAGHV